MNFISGKRHGPRALVAFGLICCFMVVNASNVAVGSCGDYLHHPNAEAKKGKLYSEKQGSPWRDFGCKNGRCKSVPSPMQNEPGRVVVVSRQPVSLARIHTCDFTSISMGKYIGTNDALPPQPSLDLLDPPPRAS